MKKTILVVISLFVIASLLAACGGAAKPTGATLLKVTGDIGKTNDGSNYVLDEAAFEANSVELVTDDPWMGDGLNYKGILLSKLIEMVKPGSGVTTISVIATDGKAVDVKIEDAKAWNIMLVHWADGVVLDEKTGGPVKIAFPAEARASYPDEQWMWWVVEIKFK